MTLFSLLLNQPQAAGAILRGTPPWVWGLLAGLLALGLSQARDRTASLTRIAVMPVAMTIFALWGLVSAFGASAMFAAVLAAWLAAALVPALAIGLQGRPAGVRYEAQARRFTLPGSWVPMALIAGIFLTKYAVGVELALQPNRVIDTSFALAVAAIYGAFSGVFTGRALRLLRLAARPLSVNIQTA
jgi:hypothetical protein